MSRSEKSNRSSTESQEWDEPKTPEEREARLREKYKHMSLSLLRSEARLVKIQAEGSPSDLRDRLVRYGLIEQLGEGAAKWIPEVDDAVPNGSNKSLIDDGEEIDKLNDFTLPKDPCSSSRRETLGAVIEAWQRANAHAITQRGDNTLQPTLNIANSTEMPASTGATRKTPRDSVEELSLAQLRKMLNFASLQEQDEAAGRATATSVPQPIQAQQATQSQANPNTQFSNNVRPTVSSAPSFNPANFNSIGFNPANVNYMLPWLNPYGGQPWPWPSGMMPPTGDNQAPEGVTNTPGWVYPPYMPQAGRPMPDRSLVRESRTSDLLNKFKIKLESRPKEDVEEFVHRIEEGQSTLPSRMRTYSR